MTTAPKKGADADEPTGRDSWQVRPVGHLGPVNVRVGPSLADAIEDCPREVKVSLAPDAVACGCAGCREDEQLLSVTVSSKTRVACPSCSREFLDREGADE